MTEGVITNAYTIYIYILSEVEWLAGVFPFNVLLLPLELIFVELGVLFRFVQFVSVWFNFNSIRVIFTFKAQSNHLTWCIELLFDEMTVVCFYLLRARSFARSHFSIVVFGSCVDKFCKEQGKWANPLSFSIFIVVALCAMLNFHSKVMASICNALRHKITSTPLTRTLARSVGRSDDDRLLLLLLAGCRWCVR